MTKQKLIQQIMRDPSAAIIVRRVQDMLDEERDRRHEFYEWVTPDVKAEFINGEIEIHSPVMKRHHDAATALWSLLHHYSLKHDLGYVGIEKLMISLTRNDYEPDICFFKKATADQFTDDQVLFPTPDFVVEILSKSNQKNIDRDRKIKFEDYEQHQISEYWIVDPEEQTVDQYQLRNGQYELLLKSKEGQIHCAAVSGFQIPIPAIFDANVNAEVLKTLLS